MIKGGRFNERSDDDAVYQGPLKESADNLTYKKDFGMLLDSKTECEIRNDEWHQQLERLWKTDFENTKVETKVCAPGKPVWYFPRYPVKHSLKPGKGKAGSWLCNKIWTTARGGLGACLPRKFWNLEAQKCSSKHFSWHNSSEKSILDQNQDEGIASC